MTGRNSSLKHSKTMQQFSSASKNVRFAQTFAEEALQQASANNLMNGFNQRRSHRHNNSQVNKGTTGGTHLEVIMPDKEIVEDAFKVEVDSMEFKQNERNDWDRISKEFVYNVDENKKIRNFVRAIKSAKLEQERTMR